MNDTDDITIFTTALVQNRAVKWLGEHLARLKEHAIALNIPYPGDDVVCGKVQLALDAKNMHLVRITLGVGLLTVTKRAIKAPSPSDYEAARIVITEIIVPKQFATIKSGYRLSYEQAWKIAAAQSAFEGLLIDDDGYVVDGTRSSPLLFRDGTLIALEGGIYGITREKVLASAHKDGIRIARARLKANELQGLLLVAGSGIGLVPAARVEDERIHSLIDFYRIRPHCL